MATNTDLQKLLEDYRSSQLSFVKKQAKVRDFAGQLENTPPEVIDDILEQIEPTDFSSKLLKLELASKLKRSLLILEYIKTGEKLLVKRALQCQWIFQDVNSPLHNPKTLVRVILPNLPYLVRMKIIRLVAKNWEDETKCEEMFTLVQNKFGIQTALQLLSNCSINFIRNCLETNRNFLLLLDRNQSLKIAKKDPNLALVFLKEIFKLVKSADDYSSNILPYKNGQLIKPIVSEETNLEQKLRTTHQKTIEYLCAHCPEEFLQLFYSNEEYHKYISFTPKPQTTKALLKSSKCKEMILKRPMKFENILVKSQIRWILSEEDFLTLFSALLPETIEEFIVKHSNLMDSWLGEKMTKGKQWGILQAGFKLKFGEEIDAFPECLSPRIIKIMDQERREKWAEVKLKEKNKGKVHYNYWDNLPNNVEGFWTSFFPIEVSISKLKTMVQSQSDVQVRLELLKFMVVSCEINGKKVKDITEVCQYVLKRFRNDSQELRQNFLSAVESSYDFRKILDDNDKGFWEVIEDFIKLATVYKEPVNTTCLDAILYHKVLFGENLQSLEAVVESAIVKNYGAWFPNESKFSEQYGESLDKRIFELYLSQLEKLYPKETPLEKYSGTEHSILQSSCESILRYLMNSKKKSKKHFTRSFKLNDYPWLAQRLQEFAEVNSTDIHLSNYAVIKIPQLMKLTKKDLGFRSSFLKQFLEKCPCPEIISYFMNKEPSTVAENIPSTLQFILGSRGKIFKRFHQFLKKLRTHGFLEISAAFVEICLEVAQDENEDAELRQNALVILSHLWDSENYLNSITLFYPTSAQIDLTDETFEAQYAVRKIIVESLTRMSYPGKCLESIRRFCIGDYLKITVGPLQSACLSSSRPEAVKFLKDLLNSPVSVKKHAIRLLLLLTDPEDIQELLTYLWETETNASIREVVMKNWVDIFTTNGANAWNPLKLAIDSLEPVKDSWVLGLLLGPKVLLTLPTHCLQEYLNNFYAKFISPKRPINDELLPYYLEKVEQLAERLDEQFLLNLLQEHLFHVDNSSDMHQVVASLASTFLFIPTNFDTKFAFIANKLRELRLQWDFEKVAKVEITVGDDATLERDSVTKPSRIALNHFITAICKQVELIKNNLRSKDVFNLLETLASMISIDFDPVDTLCEQIRLEVCKTFYQNQQNVKSTGERRIDEKILVVIGIQLNNFARRLIAEYGSMVWTFLCDILQDLLPTTLEAYDCFESDLIFVLCGFVKVQGNVSDEVAMITCKLLPNFSSKTSKLSTAYKELHNVLINHPCKIIKAQLYMKQSQS